MKNEEKPGYGEELSRRGVDGNFPNPYVRRSSRSRSESPSLESNGFLIF
jgi:hypothetical protein